MMISLMDCFYIGIILIIFGFIIHLETQVKTIKTMIEDYLGRRNGTQIKDLRKRNKTPCKKSLYIL